MVDWQLVFVYVSINRMSVRREQFLQDAFSKVMAISKKDLQKAKLFISFVGEEGYLFVMLSGACFFLYIRPLAQNDLF